MKLFKCGKILYNELGLGAGGWKGRRFEFAHRIIFLRLSRPFLHFTNFKIFDS